MTERQIKRKAEARVKALAIKESWQNTEQTYPSKIDLTEDRYTEAVNKVADYLSDKYEERLQRQYELEKKVKREAIKVEKQKLKPVKAKRVYSYDKYLHLLGDIEYSLRDTPIFTPLQKKFIAYNDRIASKGKEFTLSFEQFCDLLNSKCTYCGVNEDMTIDRVNSDIGYTPENCVPCCNQCNTMKFTYVDSKFLAKVKQIYEHLNL